MTTPFLSWEHRLVSLARAPLEHKHEHIAVKADRATLQRAYAHCERVTQEHSKTFYLASGLLPYRKRRAIRALYAFCRTTDDMVDRPQAAAVESLEVWRQRTLLEHPEPNDPVALAWADTLTSFRIPKLYAHQLIDGVAQDLTVHRYRTFDELAEYSYRVASTVGLMSMHITGFVGPEAIPYAIKLGVALQLTNILRDVREDWDSGRVYLPQDEMASFGVSEQDIATGRLSDRWLSFIRFQVQRTRRLYAEALPGVAFLHPDGRFAISAAAELYRAILDDILAHQGDVFSRRAYVDRWEKLRRLPGIWWRATRSNGSAL